MNIPIIVGCLMIVDRMGGPYCLAATRDHVRLIRSEGIEVYGWQRLAAYPTIFIVPNPQYDGKSGLP